MNAAPNGNAITFAPNTLGNVLNLNGSLNAGVAGSGTGSIAILQNGNFNGGITIVGTGTNSLTLFAGHNINGVVNISGEQNTVNNAAVFNQGLILSGSIGNSVTNQVGGQINQTFSITGSGQNTINNAGIVNNGIALSGNGVNFISNAATATINQNIVSTGTASNTLDNAGLINNSIILGAGNDIVINRLGGAVNFNLDSTRNVINGVVNMGDGANQFFMLGGTINNQVLQGSGDDMATIADGTITQIVSTGSGKDQLLWTGGRIGALDMGGGDDFGTLRNLTSANLGSITISGGLGSDRLTLDNTIASAVQRFINWELIELINGSQLTFNSTLTLGDAGTGTGSLAIDSTSTVFAGNGAHAIVPFTPGLLVSVTNAGTVDLTNGSVQPTDSLTIQGNYIGANGRLLFQTVLTGDGAPSDKLVISGGSATGASSVLITNVGGAGALTSGNGILVIDAINSAATPGTFTLAAPAVAGPYEYLLFRGSKDASAPQSWFLRSAINCAVVPTNPACVTPPIPPSPSPSPPGPGPGPEPSPVPNYRQEVSLYAAIPAMALQYGRLLMDTLHQRVGEQEHLRGRTHLITTAYNNGQWGRVIGQHGNRDGDSNGIFGSGPKYDFDFAAFQAGLDVYRRQQANSVRTHAGIYAALGGGRGDVAHFDGIAAGHDSFTGYSVGGYWTTFGPAGAYLDAVLQGTWYDMKGASVRFPALDTNGWGFAASLEGGVPFKLGGGWIVEPQAQVIYQTIGLGDSSDIAATVRFDDVDSLAGRIGMRFANTWRMSGAAQPNLVTAWLRPNLWHEFAGDPKTLFSSETGFIPFRADLGGSWLELNGGISAQIDRTTSLYANASYLWGLDGDSTAWDVKIGARVNW